MPLVEIMFAILGSVIQLAIIVGIVVLIVRRVTGRERATSDGCSDATTDVDQPRPESVDPHSWLRLAKLLEEVEDVRRRRAVIDRDNTPASRGSPALDR